MSVTNTMFLEVPTRTVTEIYASTPKEALSTFAKTILIKKWGEEMYSHLDYGFERVEISGKVYVVIPSKTIYGAFKVALNIGGKPISLQEFLGIDFVIDGLFFEDETRIQHGSRMLMETSKSQGRLKKINTVVEEVIPRNTKGFLRFLTIKKDELKEKLSCIRYLRIYKSASKSGIIKIEW